MKRDFLKELGIEDKDIINKILDENSADIGRAKGEVDDLKSQVSSLQTQLNDKKSELDGLKESTKDYSDLADKIKALELEKNQLAVEKSQLTIELDTKIAQIQKDHAIENVVRDAGAKNVKAVMALLDMDKITHKDGQLSGATEQLDALKAGNDAFLFGKAANISGVHISNPPTNPAPSPQSGSLAEAVAKALNPNK